MENENKSLISQDFCTFLEFHLCKTFKKSKDKNISSLWCDGITSNEFDLQSILKKKYIVMTAWIGKDGQDEYEMTINLGKKALNRLKEGSEIIDSIHEADNMDWINIDIEARKIEIILQ